MPKIAPAAIASTDSGKNHGVVRMKNPMKMIGAQIPRAARASSMQASYGSIPQYQTAIRIAPIASGSDDLHDHAPPLVVDRAWHARSMSISRFTLFVVAAALMATNPRRAGADVRRAAIRAR